MDQARNFKKGDQVLFHGNPAEIKLAAFDPDDPEHAWHVRKFEGRVLVLAQQSQGAPYCRGRTRQGF